MFRTANFGGNWPPLPDPASQRRIRLLEPAEKDASIPLRYPVLRSEDEEEVERLFQRLKSVGHLESKSSDEK